MIKYYLSDQYVARALPIFKFTENHTIKGVLYIAGDEYDTYFYSYGRLINLLESGILVESHNWTHRYDGDVPGFATKCRIIKTSTSFLRRLFKRTVLIQDKDDVRWVNTEFLIPIFDE